MGKTLLLKENYQKRPKTHHPSIFYAILGNLVISGPPSYFVKGAGRASIGRRNPVKGPPSMHGKHLIQWSSAPSFPESLAFSSQSNCHKLLKFVTVCVAECVVMCCALPELNFKKSVKVSVSEAL